MAKDTLKVSGVTYTHAESGYFERRKLKRAAGIWGLWGLAVGAVISGNFSGWNFGVEAAGWLDEPAAVASLALIPLRHGAADDAFGLLVLGSPDPTRYAADMGTEFLMRIGEVTSAALSRLLPQG